MNLDVPLLVGVSMLILSGCQSSRHEAVEAPVVVACSGCQTIWVGVRGAGDLLFPFEQVWENDPAEVGPLQVRSCADCRSAVESFFMTGAWEHTCETCGDRLRHCVQH